MWSIHGSGEQKFLQTVIVTHDQGGPHGHTFSFQNRIAFDLETWYEHRVFEYYKIPSNYDPRLTFDLFTQRSILVHYAFVWVIVWLVNYAETIEVYAIKVGIHSKPNDYREIHILMYQKSRTFFVQGHSISLNSNSVCWEYTEQTEISLHIEPSWDKRTYL